MPNNTESDTALEQRRHRAEIARREAATLREGLSSMFWQIYHKHWERVRDVDLVKDYDTGKNDAETRGKRLMSEDMLDLEKLIASLEQTAAAFDREQANEAQRERAKVPPIERGL